MSMSQDGPDLMVNNRNYETAILGSCITMTTLAIMTMAARVYARAFLTHSVDIDDYTIWIAIALSVVGLSIIVPEVMSGAGRWGASLSPKDLRLSLMLRFFSQLVYALSILFVKISITFCLLRFAPSNKFAWFLRGCMIFFIITSMAYFIFLTLRCQPLSMTWDPMVNGSCINPVTRGAFAYANDGISLTVDLLLATLPIPMIWNVHVALHVKFAIGFVMSLGALAAAACAFKMHYLSPAAMTGDVLFDSIDWTIWTVVECNIAIIAASVPSIIPLIKELHGKIKKPISSNDMKGFQQELPHSIPVDPTKYRTLSMQQALMNNGKKELARKHKSATEFGEISEDEMDEEDIAYMYAAASRTIVKGTPPQPNQLQQMRKLSGI